MKLYAELGHIRTRQIISDAAATAATILFLLSGVVLYRLVAVAAALGETIEDAGEAVGRVPGLGGAGTALVEAGRTQQDAVLNVALLLGVGVATLGVAAVLLSYLPRRLAWVTEATIAVEMRDSAAALQVLAYRALARRSLSRIIKAVPDPGGALAKGDYLDLAAVELEELGLRPVAHP